MGKIIDFFDRYSYAKFLLPSLLLAVCYYAFIFDNGESISQKVRQLEQSIAEKEQLVLSTQSKLKEEEKFSKEAARMSEVFSETLKFLPEKSSSTSILRDISFQARTANVNISKINAIGPFEKKGEIEELSINVELRGNFTNLANFLANLSKIPRIILAKKIELGVIDPKAKKPQLSFKAILVSYRRSGVENE